MLELTVLAVPDCPNEPVLLERLAEALADYPGATVTRMVIADEAAAARHGMRGSPTLLVNDTDPFAAQETPAGLSCRLYPGQAAGAPSVAELREALAAATAPGVSDAVGRGGLGRLAPPGGGLRAVQQAVLRSFAETGQPPPLAALEEAADPPGASARQVLRRLHEEDCLRLDDVGAISAAYPFSPVPTPHPVTVHGGPQVYAMCAIDKRLSPRAGDSRRSP